MNISPVIYKAVARAMKKYDINKDIESGYEAMKYLDSKDYEIACREFENTITK